ncbi:MAG: DeoR/GlpR family DNA-binding transcription regulator [Eubacterium sp.]|nr:DeoR/GlpR family DNA-binding transcription regulator [Eubacterium sp.]
MLTEERRAKIIGIVNEKNAVTVNELVELLDSSPATIRRDITALAKSRQLVKVYGGATSMHALDVNTNEDEVRKKAAKNVDEKNIIAEYAASLILKGDFVYLDAGTTTLAMIDYLEKKNVKFITNGIVHARKLMEKGFETIMIGGRLKASTEAVVGPDCAEFIKKYHFTKAFLGTNGISTIAGYTTPDADEALIKSAAIKHTYMSYILADHTKFDKINSVTFAELSDCCVITDKITNKDYLNYTVVKGCSR